MTSAKFVLIVGVGNMGGGMTANLLAKGCIYRCVTLMLISLVFLGKTGWSISSFFTDNFGPNETLTNDQRSNFP